MKKSPWVISTVIITFITLTIVFNKIAMEKRRLESILNSYVDETQNYSNQNKTALNTIFLRLFNEADQCGDEGCYSEIKQQLQTLLPPTLRKYSQTKFMKWKVNDDTYPYGMFELLHLDGTVGEDQTAHPDHAYASYLLANILNGKDLLKAVYWYQIGGYDTGRYTIVIPYSVEGKIVGAIVRDTGEQRSSWLDLLLPLPELRIMSRANDTSPEYTN